MSLFSRKTAEEKAAKKALKAETSAKRDTILQLFSKTERFSYSGSIIVAADELRDGEIVHFAATGKHKDQGADAALLATDQRIIIGWMKGVSMGTTEIRYADLDQIDVGIKLSGAWATLRHQSHSTTLEKSVTKNLEKLKTVVRERQDYLTSQQDPKRTSPHSENSTNQLEKLAELHAEGVLTDEEFTAAKAKALGL